MQIMLLCMAVNIVLISFRINSQIYKGELYEKPIDICENNKFRWQKY